MSNIKQCCMSKIGHVVIDVKGLVQRKVQRKIKGQCQRLITYSIREENHLHYAANHHSCDKESMHKFMDIKPLLWVSKPLFMCTKFLV